MPNQSLQPTVNPLRGLSAAELVVSFQLGKLMWILNGIQKRSNRTGGSTMSPSCRPVRFSEIPWNLRSIIPITRKANIVS